MKRLWLFAATAALVFTGCDPYAKLMKEQGYTIVNVPRSKFGTGTILKFQGTRNELFVGTPEQCFPGIEKELVQQEVVLKNSVRTVSFDLSVGAKYVPIPATELGATFGFKTVKKLTVSFGEAKADEMTLVTLGKFLEDRKVSRTCLAFLKDVENRLLVSAVKVAEMKYKLEGEKQVGGKLDAEALGKTLKANGVVNFKTGVDDSFSVSQPMYIAYKAVKFVDAGIPILEVGGAVQLTKGLFRLEPEPVLVRRGP